MIRVLLAVIIALLVAIGIVLYRSRDTGLKNVEPHAREAIEKAKRR